MTEYTPAQAARYAGVSSASIRTYTTRFKEYFSPQATPPKGEKRTLTTNDVRLMVFIARITATGASYTEVAERLAAGEHEDFEWYPPELQDRPPAEAEEQPPVTAALVANQIVTALTSQLNEFRQEVSAARAREADLYHKLAELHHQVGHLEGELTATKRELEVLRAVQKEEREEEQKPWWRRLFGG